MQELLRIYIIVLINHMNFTNCIDIDVAVFWNDEKINKL